MKRKSKEKINPKIILISPSGQQPFQEALTRHNPKMEEKQQPVANVSQTNAKTDNKNLKIL